MCMGRARYINLRKQLRRRSSGNCHDRSVPREMAVGVNKSWGAGAMPLGFNDDTKLRCTTERTQGIGERGAKSPGIEQIKGEFGGNCRCFSPPGSSRKG